MIWGKTYEQLHAEREAAKTPHRVFAWRPTLLKDGRWVWLRTLTRWLEWDAVGMRVIGRGWWWRYDLPAAKEPGR